jgi:hypothetical protein
MHLNDPRHELTWCPRSRHRKHLPRAQRLKARLWSRPSRSGDNGARLRRQPRPTWVHPSSSSKAAAAAERPRHGSAITCSESETVPLEEANGEANSSPSWSSTEHAPAEIGPPEAAGGSDKNPRPSINTAGSDEASKVLGAAGSVQGLVLRTKG